MEERNKKHIAIVEEAVKILEEHPELTHTEALGRAKIYYYNQILKDGWIIAPTKAAIRLWGSEINKEGNINE